MTPQPKHKLRVDWKLPWWSLGIIAISLTLALPLFFVFIHIYLATHNQSRSSRHCSLPRFLSRGKPSYQNGVLILKQNRAKMELMTESGLQEEFLSESAQAIFQT
uniref:Uncharacterized protein n=1 Tax=Odontella aurita TaxID=265563 RepID=A0A7S4NGV5_9STRA|mmetsp:Transcript_6609/g.19494  ORF Transcript_6609/g.19494 Transcript_6609/m.19494 type:complete len:105 (+) Transcript_6609:38-352(+)